MKTPLAVAVLVLAVMFATSFAGEGHDGISPDKAIEMLKAGNARHVSGHPTHPHESAARLHEIAQGQKPFAIILGCADSRVPPELVFDAGLGDLFDVRVAGNIVDDAVIGSIEYAVEHLGTTLIVVLGHERCGAVQAAYDGGEAAGHLGTLVEHLKSAVEKAKKQPGDGVDNAVRINATQVAEELRNSKPILSKAVAEGKIKIVAARYDLDDGKVQILP
jgi:carbonic anhydrase